MPRAKECLCRQLTGQGMAAKDSRRDLTESGEEQLTLKAGDMEDGCGKDLKWKAGLET